MDLRNALADTGTGPYRTIIQKEKDTLNILGINFIWGANDGGASPYHLLSDSLVMDWADHNSGYPKLALWDPLLEVDTAWPHYDTTQFKDYEIIGFSDSWYQAHTLYANSGNRTSHYLNMDAWIRNKPNACGLGNHADSVFKDSTRILVGFFKHDYNARNGFGMLYMGNEEHEWKWHDSLYIPYDSAEAVARRWRRGMGFIAQTATITLTRQFVVQH